jgi:hypothetical protein
MSIQDDINYYNDPRVKAQRNSWFESFDEKNMEAVVLVNEESVKVSCSFGVCPTCEGKGSHVNPSIDCNGLSQEDFNEDPDFLEDYLSGQYDVPCYECKGKRVIPVCTDEKVLQAIEDQQREDEIAEAEYLSEVRMGA